jgi:hypothetical protein
MERPSVFYEEGLDLMNTTGEWGGVKEFPPTEDMREVFAFTQAIFRRCAAEGREGEGGGEAVSVSPLCRSVSWPLARCVVVTWPGRAGEEREGGPREQGAKGAMCSRRRTSTRLELRLSPSAMRLSAKLPAKPTCVRCLFKQPDVSSDDTPLLRSDTAFGAAPPCACAVCAFVCVCRRAIEHFEAVHELPGLRRTSVSMRDALVQVKEA